MIQLVLTNIQGSIRPGCEYRVIVDEVTKIGLDGRAGLRAWARLLELPSQTLTIPTIIGTLVIDCSARRVQMNNVEIRLSRMEYNLLAELATRPGQVVTTEQLLGAVWNCSANDRAAQTTLRTTLTSLRRNLGDKRLSQAKLIVSLPRVGYRLAVVNEEVTMSTVQGEESDAFKEHILVWIKQKLDPNALLVEVVSGYGTDWEGGTLEGFWADNYVTVRYITTNTGEGYLIPSERQYSVNREIRGEEFQSLWHWVVNSWCDLAKKPE